MKIDNKGNGHSPINCESPSIVINYSWLHLWHRYRYLHGIDLNGSCFILDYWQYCNNTQEYMYKYIMSCCPVTLDNYQCFGFGSVSDILEPLFYVFPCGHCSLCREKKAKEYSFRATAETNTYPADPLFLTITYNDTYLPADGVCLNDIQRFFKRLRARLSFMGLPTNFRYICVAEYGAKGGRPHYHIQLWNYPVKSFKTEHQAYGVIRFAWLDYVRDDLGKRVYFTRKKDGKRFPRMRSRGFIKILPVTDGCTGYIVKYFGKGSSNPMNYANKTFLLSSRRNGGIGSQWIREQAQFVHENPSCSLTCIDPNSQTVFKSGICGYVRTLLYPTKSRIFGKYHEFAKHIINSLEKMRVLQHFANKFERFKNDFRKDMGNVFKGIRYYYEHKPLNHLLREYSWYRHYNYEQIYRDFVSLTKKVFYFWDVLKDVVGDFNRQLYERDAWLAEHRLYRKDVWFSIPTSIHHEQDKYNRYYERCMF